MNLSRSLSFISFFFVTYIIDWPSVWFHIQFTLTMSMRESISTMFTHTASLSFAFSWLTSFRTFTWLKFVRWVQRFFISFLFTCICVNVFAYLNPTLDYSQRYSFGTQLGTVNERRNFAKWKKKSERYSPHLENNCTFKIYLTEKENRTITIKTAAISTVAAATTTALIAIVWLKWTVTRLMCVLCALY